MFKFLGAVFILVGFIIGVGMFGIPFSLAQVGFWPGIVELVVLAAITLGLHLAYGAVALETETLHRLPGYVRLYLGRRPLLLSSFSAVFGIAGSLLAYVIAGSLFLQTIFAYFSTNLGQGFWVFLFVAVASVIALFSNKKEAVIGGILTSVLIAFIILIVVWLLPHVRLENLQGFYPRNLLLPYGVILFALSGGIVIPDVVTFLGRDKKRVYSAIVIGTLIPAFLYIVFAFGVIGTLGTAVTPEAIRGLRVVAGENMVLLGSVVGFLAVFTSFIILNRSFQELLHLDFGMSPVLAWASASFIGLLLYSAGFHNFVAIVGAVGAVSIGIDAVLVVTSYHAMKRKQNHDSRWSHFWEFGIAGLVVFGILFEIYKHF